MAKITVGTIFGCAAPTQPICIDEVGLYRNILKVLFMKTLVIPL